MAHEKGGKMVTLLNFFKVPGNSLQKKLTPMVPKARYAMTEGHGHFQLGVWVAVSPQAGPWQDPGGGQGPKPLEAPNILLFYGTKKS